MGVDDATYAFANARAIQHERLRLLEALLDEGTFRLLGERVGVKPGWRCLEVGAGGGSVAGWLCDRVAPDGLVIATDLDTTVLSELERPNLEVRIHDIVSQELPEREFDLVHARLLLAWLSEPLAALRRMIAAVNPGGYLVSEEMDFVTVLPDPRLDARMQLMFSRVMAAHNTLLADQHAFDPLCGRRISGYLSDAGLVNVRSEGRVSMWQGGQPGGMVWRLTLIQLRGEMLATGLVGPSELDAVIELCSDPRLRFMSQVVMGAWGSRGTLDRVAG